jgi:hypothetical protein
LCLMVEAGWAPWVSDGGVTINSKYSYRDGASIPKTWFNKNCHVKSDICSALNTYKEMKEKMDAVWVPWANIVAEKEDDNIRTNSRCSMASCYWLPTLEASVRTYSAKSELGLIRPVILTDLYKGKNTPELTVVLTHAISCYLAKREQQDLTGIAEELSDKPVLFVGDFNVDLLKSKGGVKNLGKEWSVINAGQATQKSGGELDYALLWDPNQTIKVKTAKVLAQYKSDTNQSDHSVIMYEIA